MLQIELNSLTNSIYEEQKSRNWPGLEKETTVKCQTLMIHDCNETNLGKSEYLILVREAIKKNIYIGKLEMWTYYWGRLWKEAIHFNKRYCKCTTEIQN